MKQIWLRKTGGPEVLRVEETSGGATPLGEREVEIDVKFSGVNFADVMMRYGLYQDAPKRPYVPGYEVSGLVRAVGSKVTRFRVGERVVAGTLFGGYTSLLRVSDAIVFPLPDSFTLEEGAALPVNWVTAHAAIHDMGRVRKGDRVLVDAASGGVGSIALQLLKKAGAETVGLTSSPSKKAFIESFGATALTHEEFLARKDLPAFDLILNSQGGKTVRAHYDRLAPTGRIVCFGMSSGMRAGRKDLIAFIRAALAMPRFSLISMFDPCRGVYGLNALSLFKDERYRTSLAGKWAALLTDPVKPHIGKIFPAAEAGQAQLLLENRGTTGKVILRW